MKKFLFTAFLFLIPTIANAQTTTSLLWDHIGATPAQTATFNHVIKVDDVVITGTPTCIVNGANTTCKFPVGVLANGSHTFNVSTLVDNVLRETILTKTFPLTGGNAQPVNPKFTITIIISVP